MKGANEMKAMRELLELPDMWLDVIKDDGSIVEYVSAWEAQVRNKCANELQSALEAADIAGLVARVEQLEADRTATITCPACGSESATSNHLAINKRVHELEAHSQEGWDKYKELRKEVANNRYPKLTAMLNAESVMESQSILITKLKQEIAEADDATSNAQWRFEQAEATINKLREVVPKLVEVAEGGTRP